MNRALIGIKQTLYICGPVRGVAQPGSALRSGRRGRGFESRHPDQNSSLVTGYVGEVEVVAGGASAFESRHPDQK